VGGRGRERQYNPARSAAANGKPTSAVRRIGLLVIVLASRPCWRKSRSKIRSRKMIRRRSKSKIRINASPLP